MIVSASSDDCTEMAEPLTPTSSSNSTTINADRNTPGTCPSTPSSLNSTWANSLNGCRMSEEVTDLFGDIANYIALGCLCFEDLITTSKFHAGPGWQDVTQLPLLPGCEESIADGLARLLRARWIRIQSGQSTLDSNFRIFRIYLLPGDIGHRFIDRSNKRLSLALESLLPHLNVSADTWNGLYRTENSRFFDPWATVDEGSLFYMFNKLPSPAPSTLDVKEKYAHEALEDLLDPASILPGLKTTLYPYQRRAAGLMLSRESVATLTLDPRIEPRIAPDGSAFFYGARDLLFLRQPRYYETCRGGILAETMGLGKTVILLAMILATKNQPPRIPPQYNLTKTRPATGRLTDMAVSAIHSRSIPWRVEFERIKFACGDDMKSCEKKLEVTPAAYNIPVEPGRWNRNTVLPEPKKITMAATTLVVVPRNLCKQWQLELRKHVESEALRVLVMDNPKFALPPPDELRTYDVVLFSRNRWDLELKDGVDEQGRRFGNHQFVCYCPYVVGTMTRDCHCVRTDLYESPLLHLHFKRLIVDEGHFFSNTSIRAVTVANKLVRADHRWVVSGTPAKDLLGVEVDTTSSDNLWRTPEAISYRNMVLDQRRHFSPKEDTGGAVKSLGVLASNFLKIRPWYATEFGQRKAEWDDYIYRHEHIRRRTYSGFSAGLRRTLEAIVIKTKPEDVEKDIALPPFSHEIVRLEPSFYDKITANLFTLVLTANAVTAERTGADYLFHQSSQKSRNQLISNLRQSAFSWTAFSETDILATVKNSTGYLAKEGTGCTDADRKLLTETLTCVDDILASIGWKSLSRSHDVGLTVDNWPAESAQHWSFDESQTPLLTGLSPLLEAQRHLNERIGTVDPGEGLGGAGIRALASVRRASGLDEKGGAEHKEDYIFAKSGIPVSGIDGEPSLKRRGSMSAISGKASPSKRKRDLEDGELRIRSSPSKKAKNTSSNMAESNGLQAMQHQDSTPEPTTPIGKERRYEIDGCELDPESPYSRTRIIGTTSAKLSYLMSQIVRYSEDEKILIFHDGDNSAYYISQALELLHIKHEIYAKSLAASLKAENVVRFNEESEQRVLLMDVKEAAFGLNLSSASRIYFVNPVYRPNIEAQAIKRAHRIGQTRKVSVETLVLKGTIEEKMLERSKRMTRLEHLDAKTLEDDGGIREILQSARLIPVFEREKSGYGQMAPLKEPQQLWNRPGWRGTITLTSARSTVKRRRELPQNGVKLNDATAHDEDDRALLDDSPIGNPMRRKVAFVDCGDSGVAAHGVRKGFEPEFRSSNGEGDYPMSPTSIVH